MAWRFALLVCVVIGLAAAAAPAVASPPELDQAEGAGKYTLGFEWDFAFSAHQLGFGERATGTWSEERLTSTGMLRRYVGRVTCLNVLGEMAVFAGIITASPPNPAPGFETAVGFPFVKWVVDNGAPGSDPPDLISGLVFIAPEELFLFPSGFPNICPSPFPSLFGYFPVMSGNIVIEDESPPHGLPIEG